MKKIISLLISLTMIFAITACGNKDASTEKPEGEPAIEETSGAIDVAGQTFTLESVTQDGKELENVADTMEIVFSKDGTCSRKDIERGKVLNETSGKYAQNGENIAIKWKITDEWTDEITMTLHHRELIQTGDAAAYDENGNEKNASTTWVFTLK